MKAFKTDYVKKITYNSITYSFLALYLLFIIFPILWLVQASFKTQAGCYEIPPEIIWEPRITSYIKLFGSGLIDSFKNSAIVASSAVILSLLLGIPAAYGLARLKTVAGENIGFFILSVRMAPLFAVIVPIYMVMRYLHLLDTIFAVMVAHLVINLPLAIWLLKSYFEGVPEELEDAAIVDGATRLQTLIHVVVPVSIPMIAAVSALVFLLSWNEFLFAFILTSQSARTVPVLVSSLAGTMAFDFPLMSAVSSFALIPALLLVVYLQKHMVRGLTLGAVE